MKDIFKTDELIFQTHAIAEHFWERMEGDLEGPIHPMLKEGFIGGFIAALAVCFSEATEGNVDMKKALVQLKESQIGLNSKSKPNS